MYILKSVNKACELRNAASCAAIICRRRLACGWLRARARPVPFNSPLPRKLPRDHQFRVPGLVASYGTIKELFRSRSRATSSIAVYSRGRSPVLWCVRDGHSPRDINRRDTSFSRRTNIQRILSSSCTYLVYRYSLALKTVNAHASSCISLGFFAYRRSRAFQLLSANMFHPTC